MYLLDTNILFDIIRQPLGPCATRAAAIDPGDLVTSLIVACELRYGIARKASPELRARVDGALDRIAILPLGDDATTHYRRLRADLERRGEPIGGNDLLIAAHALALDATLVTDNIREFTRVEGLAIENRLRNA